MILNFENVTPVHVHLYITLLLFLPVVKFKL